MTAPARPARLTRPVDLMLGVVAGFAVAILVKVQWTWGVSFPVDPRTLMSAVIALRAALGAMIVGAGLRVFSRPVSLVARWSAVALLLLTGIFELLSHDVDGYPAMLATFVFGPAVMLGAALSERIRARQ